MYAVLELTYLPPGKTIDWQMPPPPGRAFSVLQYRPIRFGSSDKYLFRVMNAWQSNLSRLHPKCLQIFLFHSHLKWLHLSLGDRHFEQTSAICRAMKIPSGLVIDRCDLDEVSGLLSHHFS